jgi:hypothetical protein
LDEASGTQGVFKKPKGDLKRKHQALASNEHLHFSPTPSTFHLHFNLDFLDWGWGKKGMPNTLYLSTFLLDVKETSIHMQM